jgi:hypothetical protein
MFEENTNPRIEKLVAYLYGEMPEAEERAFRRLLEKDDELRAEYEELRGAREVLGAWQVESAASGFLLVPEEEKAPSASAAMGWFARLRAAVNALGGRPAWGLATGAAIVLVLALGGFRVERIDGGLAFTIGDGSSRELRGEPGSVAPVLPSGEPLEFRQGSSGVPAGLQDRLLTTNDARDLYLTREEFDYYTTDMMGSFVSFLNDYDLRRGNEMSGLVREMYRRISDQQSREYEELRRQIDALGVELLLRETRFDDTTGVRPLVPNRPRPGSEREE